MAAKELVIHANTKGIEIALLEDKRLVEYYIQPFKKEGFNAGDIYLGRIKKLNPALNAAFVDIGHEKDAFLHYSDLSPYLLSNKKYTADVLSGSRSGGKLDNFALQPEIPKDGTIDKVLAKGDIFLCQILKEAISTKGPRLTCEVTIPGRYIVLAPFSNSIGISRKIEQDKERKRVTKVLEPLKPRNFGFVVRTNALGVTHEALKNDIGQLTGKWQEMTNSIKGQRPPKLLLAEMQKSLTIIRDLLNDSFARVITDSPDIMDEMKEYLMGVSPGMVEKLFLHQSPKPLFEVYDVSRQVKTGFGKTVTMKSGAYLVVEHTEAMHVVDINSGPKVKHDVEQDLNAFNVNSEAALEVARQLRLRDIGGIIVIDFIDMRSGEYKHKLLEVMQQAMAPDKAKHSILPISKFGLMEITRQRVREQLNIDTTEPRSNTGRMESSLLLIDKIERDILSIPISGFSRCHLYVHPFVHAYLTKSWMKQTLSWYKKTNKWISIHKDSSLNLTEYRILDGDGQSVLVL
jgi:ribonuclease G